MASKNRQTFVTNMISATVQRANLNPMDRARMDDMVAESGRRPSGAAS